jgi:hypothetical protein
MAAVAVVAVVAAIAAQLDLILLAALSEPVQ